jgi:hypothetical protein
MSARNSHVPSGDWDISIEGKDEERREKGFAGEPEAAKDILGIPGFHLVLSHDF